LTESISPGERLAAIALELQRGEPSPQLSVREFLWWWEVNRRGYWIVEGIRKSLAAANIHTVPDFESAYINSSLTFAPGTASPPAASVEEPGVLSAGSDGPTLTNTLPSSTVSTDPTYRISMLAAANNRPTTVTPDSSVSAAVTIMMSCDFSQLPVMTNDRDVKGVTTWKTIGSRLGLGQAPATVRDAMDPPVEIASDASIFAALPLIVEHQYVLVRAPDRRIVGIVTTSDLSLQYHALAEPFLLIGEIENHLRKMIGPRFSAVDLESVRDPNDSTRNVMTAADLTFGEYTRLLEEPLRWAQLDLALDRKEFLQTLERVRRIRNDVMHFDPDPIDAGDVATLRHAVRFMRTLVEIGVV
jgi:CBS domain-containing protein